MNKPFFPQTSESAYSSLFNKDEISASRAGLLFLLHCSFAKQQEALGTDR